MSRKAFTLIEIIFVVVIIGILSAVIAPRVKRATLQEAADQVASHIRYTQQLALNDDMFDPTDSGWFKKRWQIQFRKVSGHDIYTIYSNKDGSGSNAIQTDIAKNPLNAGQLLTGNKSISTSTAKYTKAMDLTAKYDIKSVSFSKSCSYRGSKRLSYDYLGRPLYANPVALDKKYLDGVSGNRIVVSTCIITFLDSVGKSIKIAIEPETGYVHIL